MLREFVPRQKIIEKVSVEGGALRLIAADGSVTTPAEGDVVVVCTGQRAEGFGPGCGPDWI